MRRVLSTALSSRIFLAAGAGALPSLLISTRPGSSSRCSSVVTGVKAFSEAKTATTLRVDADNSAPSSVTSAASNSRIDAGFSANSSVASSPAAPVSQITAEHSAAPAVTSENMARPSPATLGAVELVRADDSSVSRSWGSLWADRPLVALFLRRLGCQMCRVNAQDLEGVRSRIEAMGARVVCISFETFGEGSDTDRSWSAGGYFKGEVWVDRKKDLYKALFERKGLLSGFGLFDMDRERVRQVRERGVTGNYSGDGFQLGGTFVIDSDGRVVLDHRARRYGDDASTEDILEALAACRGLKPAPAAGGDAAAGPTAGTTSASDAAAGGAGAAVGAPAEPAAVTAGAP